MLIPVKKLSNGVKSILRLRFLRGNLWKKARQSLYINTIRYNCRGKSKEWQYSTLMHTVAPWHTYPYEQQLKILQDFLRQSLVKLGNKVGKNTPNPPPEFIDRLKQFERLPCPLEPIIPSPVINGYRNKSRFVISQGFDGNTAIGFYMSPGVFPVMPVSNQRELPNQNIIHYNIAQKFQKFVRESGIPGLGALVRSGPHWKNIEVRTNRRNEVAIGVVFDSDGAPKEFMDDIKQNCIDFFFKGPGNEFNVKSLYFQDCPLSVCLHGQAPYEHLHGDTAIMETLLGCTFRIVPGNFFQVNVAAAEIMYEQIRQEAGFTKDSILLDLCCGTGIVSIIMSPHVKKSIGIELLQSSIDTAKQTAQLNGVTNVEFIQGKVERKLRLVTHNLKGAEVIAIVNPSRGGLGRVVLDEIRRCKSIRKVIYVSCKPMGRPLFNIMRLCQSGETLGKPFLVNRAISIDMFPHTRHYEVIFSLQR